MLKIDFNSLIDLFKFDQYDPLLFGSSLFLFLFFFMILFYRMFAGNRHMRIILLLIFSLFFYYKAAGFYFILLIASALINFQFGKWIYRAENPASKKLFLITSLVLNLGALAYFKYTNFFFQIVSDLSIGQLDPLDIFLPIGISFYTFKSLSYIIDIYLESMEPVESLRDFSLFVFFFPNILAGPIDRAAQFLPQLQNDYFLSKKDIARALILIMIGLIKKNMIADYINLNFVGRVFDDPLRFTGAENLFAVYGYALQIYCDFSGYSDIAIGIALLLGFKLMDNFNSPYQAVSIADFWRRWHISLSTWLLDYLFKPLQMKFRNLRNYGNAIALTITFLICGLWHGPSWSFVVWGGLHGLFMSTAIFLQKPKKRFYKKTGLAGTRLLKFGQTFVTLHLLAFTWIFFRADTFENGWNVISQILFFFKPVVVPQFIEGYTPTFILIVIGYFFHYLPKSIGEKSEDLFSKVPFLLQALIFTIVIWVVAQIQSADLQPFIYFQF